MFLNSLKHKWKSDMEMGAQVPPAEVELSAEERATTGLFQAATPSVVNIINIRTLQDSYQYIVFLLSASLSSFGHQKAL